jgi:hypothetical protein
MRLINLRIMKKLRTALERRIHLLEASAILMR